MLYGEKLLNYANSHSYLPFLYKMRCVNGNNEFFVNINKYVQEREFTPLLRTPEFKGLFDSSIRSNTQDMVVKYIYTNITSILNDTTQINKISNSMLEIASK